MAEFLCMEDEHGSIRLEIPVVQVVRCRDCEHATDDGYGCTLFGRREQVGSYRWEDVPAEVEPDGFCAWGGRRDA